MKYTFANKQNKRTKKRRQPKEREKKSLATHLPFFSSLKFNFVVTWDQKVDKKWLVILYTTSYTIFRNNDRHFSAKQKITRNSVDFFWKRLIYFANVLKISSIFFSIREQSQHCSSCCHRYYFFSFFFCFYTHFSDAQNFNRRFLNAWIVLGISEKSPQGVNYW